jgi:ribose/xylose/arabinose/galactoside ABC-type transport system permease subunit
VRRYTLVSGLFLSLLACVQLLRVVMRWPVQVAGLNVPVWVSVLAALVVGALAIWAFRARAHPDRAAAV